MSDSRAKLIWSDGQGRELYRRVTKHDDGTFTFEGSGTSIGQPLGYVQVNDLHAAVSLQNVPEGTSMATVVVEGAGVRVRKDGQAPTAAVGTPIPAGGVTILRGAEITAAQFIQQSSGAILNVEYEM